VTTRRAWSLGGSCRGSFRAQSFICAPDDLAAIHFALADNLGDLSVIVGENFVQEEDRPFDG
jgi:hypothetical protein